MNQDVSKNIHRASLLLVASMLISRVIGFFREMVLAHALGASPMTDVYYASFTIPDFLNSLMAAGALSISFIPVLNEYLAKKDEEMGKKLFRAISTLMGSLLIFLIFIAEIFAQPLAHLIAPGFSLDQQEVLIKLIRIILPGQFFFYWGGLVISVQHTHGKFLLPALAPIVYNLLTILCGVLLHSSMGVTGFSIGILLGSVFGQGVLQWWGIRKLGYSIRPYFGFRDPQILYSIKRYFWISIPIMLGFSLTVTDEWMTKYFASSLESRAISWLSYARTEMRIPIAILGQAAGIASFPYLSRLWSQKEFPLYGKALLREISKILALAPVAALFVIHFALPLTHFLYGGGKFTYKDLIATSEALKIYGVAIIFWTVQILLTRGFYASLRTWFPSFVGSALSVLLIPLYGYLAHSMGYIGLALAGTLGIGIYCLILGLALVHHLSKNCRPIEFGNFIKFLFGWSLVLLGLFIASKYFTHLGIYRDTKLSGLAEVLVAATALGIVVLILIRKVFVRWTDGPLF